MCRASRVLMTAPQSDQRERSMEKTPAAGLLLVRRLLGRLDARAALPMTGHVAVRWGRRRWCVLGRWFRLGRRLCRRADRWGGSGRRRWDGADGWGGSPRRWCSRVDGWSGSRCRRRRGAHGWYGSPCRRRSSAHGWYGSAGRRCGGAVRSYGFAGRGLGGSAPWRLVADWPRRFRLVRRREWPGGRSGRQRRDPRE